MAILLITILIIIIFILAIICIKRGSKIISLKNQIEFLEYNLEQLTEKEKTEQNSNKE